MEPTTTTTTTMEGKPVLEPITFLLPAGSLKRLAGVTVASSKDTGRPILGLVELGIDHQTIGTPEDGDPESCFVTLRGVVTDSYRLGIVTIETAGRTDSRLDDYTRSFPVELLVPAAGLRDAAKALKDRMSPITVTLNPGEVYRSGKTVPGHTSVTFTQGSASLTIGGNRDQDQSYPNWKQLVPEYPSRDCPADGKLPAYAAEYLADLTKLSGETLSELRKGDTGKPNPWVLHSGPKGLELAPGLFTRIASDIGTLGRGSFNQTNAYLLMPVRIES